MLNRNKRRSSQSGFTLVEIAIVLVIIGLLIGGILKGQSMIESAKVKSLAKDFDAVATAYNGYQDKYRAIPGDDGNVLAHLGASATQATVATAGNGSIDTGTWVGASVVAAADESSVFWEHVRTAGLISGSKGLGEATNTVGGKLGITGNGSRPSFPAGVSGTFVVCSGGINGALAKQLDTMMDDGVATTGRVFAAVGAALVAATPPAAYVDASVYTVCHAY